MNNKDYIGAEWISVDLHLHSPGVESFTLPSGINLSSDEDREKLVEEYVKRLKEAGIRIAGITDYNGIREDWFIPIKEKAEEEGIKVFPGVELSLREGKYGIHILLIFDDTVNIYDVNVFLKYLNKDERNLIDDRKHIDIEAEDKLDKLIEKIKGRFNPLIIIPHPNEGDSKGLLNSFSPQDAVNYLKTIKPDGIEYLTDTSIRKLKNAGLSDEFLSRIAIIENSDPKSFDEIGTKERDGKLRATYLKLSDFTLDSVKLALHDPQVRVRVYEKPKIIHDRIVKVKINGTTFLSNIEISLNPELNSLIGGRGVGKSAILEAIRYCLGLPIYQDEDARRKFVYNVVGSGGEIEVEIERFYGNKKFRYLVKRTIGKESELIDLDSSQKISLDVHQLFDGKSPILIGQKELYYVASDKKFQLSLVDNLIGEDVKKKQKELDETINKFNENAEQIVRLREKLTKKDEYEQELKNIEDEIKIFERLKVVDKLKRWTDIIDNEQRLNKAGEVLKETVKQIEISLEEGKDSIEGQIAYLKRGKPEGKEALDEAINILFQYNNFIKNILNDFRARGQEAVSYYENVKKKWDLYKKGVEEEVNEIKRNLGKEKLKPERLEELIGRRANLQALIKEMEKIEEEIKSKLEKRERIKEELKKKRHELFEIRQKEIENINKLLKGRARLRIEFEKEMDSFEQEIKSLTSGSGIRGTVVENIIKREDLAIDGMMLSEYIDEGEQKLKKEFDFTDAMARKFVEYFSDDKRRFKLETLFPEDRIIIELKVNEDYKPIEELSIGQKATSLLLLLFAYENRILIFDQPEEDLDNRFIYEDVVKILREFKGKRQIIVATHNANIPVIGDSELILVLEAKKDRCMIIDKGSVDKSAIKQAIKQIMEGGEEAFRLRIEKYGGI
jgi:ABC-type lipoprotein export system ATPase subunit